MKTLARQRGPEQASSQGQLALLKSLNAQLDELVTLEAQVDCEEWIALRARAVAAVHHHNTVRRRLRGTLLAIEAEETETQRCRNEIDRIKAEMRGIELERDAALSIERQAVLKRDIELLDRDWEDLRRPIPGKDGAAAAIRNLGFLKPLVDLAESSSHIFDLIDEANPLLPSPLHAELPSKPKRLDEIARELVEAMPALTSAIESIRQRLVREEAELSGRHKQLGDQIAAAKEGRRVLSPNVQAMIARLMAVGMKPRILAEMVDIAEERWASAAEGFLGVDREAIFVAPEHCHPATDILARERAQFRRVRIANTRKLRSMRRQVDRGTLASIFQTADPLAEAFLVYRTGSVQLAASKADFDRPGRWILDDGTYDDGIVIDVKEPQDGLKLGAKGIVSGAAIAASEFAAVVRHLEAKREDLRVYATIRLTWSSSTRSTV